MDHKIETCKRKREVAIVRQMTVHTFAVREREMGLTIGSEYHFLCAPTPQKHMHPPTHVPHYNII